MSPTDRIVAFQAVAITALLALLLMDGGLRALAAGVICSFSLMVAFRQG